MTLHLSAHSFAPDHSQPVRQRWLIVAPAKLRDAPLRPQDLSVHVRWPQVGAGLLAALDPDTVLAPLLTPAWDVLDLARDLTALGYAGRVLIDAPRLPRPQMVLAELRAQCPRLAFGLLAA